MSVMMVLEFDHQISTMEIRDILARCDVSALAECVEGFTGNFPSSNMFFSCEHYDSKGGYVRAEDENVDWDVGGRMIFVYMMSAFEACSMQLHNFLLAMSNATTSSWVLSFQYESICAIRDYAGIHWLKDF